MTKSYQITGMTCESCVAHVKAGLESIEEVKSASVDLKQGVAIVEFNEELPISELQASIGDYKISTASQETPEHIKSAEEESSFEWKIYKPLFILIGLILLVTIFVQFPFDTFLWKTWMRHFMAGFFLSFSFFKLINISGFSSSYRMYDVVAKRIPVWGYIYPFIELSLGVLYLINIAPFMTNLVTAIVLGVSSIGVIESTMNKRKIKCACLGDVFNLPMSTITIVEDLAMVIMAIIMLISL